MTTLVPNEVVALVFAGDLSPMRAWREHLGLTRAEVAKKAGITREALYKALRPNASPRFDTISRVCQALGVRLEARPIQG